MTRPISRSIAIEYMWTLLRVADYCRAVIVDDPGLAGVRPRQILPGMMREFGSR
jgi:hypothetical protein